MANPRQPYKGLSKQRLVDMANEDNNTTWILDEDLQFGEVKVRTSPGGRNSAIEVLPLKPTHKQQTLTYTRLPLDVMYSLSRDQIRPVKLESVPFSIHEKLDEINDALGLTLLPEEVLDETHTEIKGIYELQIVHNTASVAWLQSSYQFVADFGLPDQRYDTYGWPRIDTYGYLRRDQSQQTGGGGDEDDELVASITFQAVEGMFPMEDSGSSLYFLSGDSTPLGMTGSISLVITHAHEPLTGLMVEAFTIQHENNELLDYRVEFENNGSYISDSASPRKISAGYLREVFPSNEPATRVINFYKRTAKERVDIVEVKAADVTAIWIETNPNVTIEQVKTYAYDSLVCGLYSGTGQRLDGLVSASSSLANFDINGFTIKKSTVNGKEIISIVGHPSPNLNGSTTRKVNVEGRIIEFTHSAYPFFEETVFKETDPQAYAEWEAILNLPTIRITEELQKRIRVKRNKL